MRIVWDEPKRLANFHKHGLDFADITEDFFLDAYVRPGRAGRFRAIGRADGLVALIFARLGTEGLSIISLRPASAKERMLYDTEALHRS